MNSNPVQRSLTPRRVLLSLQIIAYYDLIRDSQSLLIAYFLRLSGLCPTVSYGLEPRGSPICSAYLSLRAAFHTPAVQPGAHDCSFPDRCSLHPTRKGSATALHAGRFSRGRVTRSRHGVIHFMLRPGVLLALHRQGRLLPSFRPMSHLNWTSTITMRVNNQFPQPDFHR